MRAWPQVTDRRACGEFAKGVNGMGANSRIEWTHHTFNPWWGCTEVSPGCDHCYARGLAKRFGFAVWGKGADRRFFGDAHWDEPRKWNAVAEREGERKRVFCGSMCDVMEDIAVNWERARLYKLIEETEWLDWLLVTKRPQNYRRLLPAAWLDAPLRNVWGLTTVESQEFTWRIEELLKTPFVVRGISAEPLLGLFSPQRQHCVGKAGTEKIDWVIAGGESGPGARPTHPQLFREIRDWCVEAGVPFFFKQWGEWAEVPSVQRAGDTALYTIGAELPAVVMRRVGKAAAGRLLDGVEWSQVPGVRC